MSEQWMGLHHPERHRDNGADYTWCAECENHDESGCFPADPCRCCLEAEVETLRAQVQAVRDVCEQQVKDRSPYSDDRYKHGLDRIDGWNDALDIVEQALDGAQVSERLMSRAEVESVTYKALVYALAEVAALRWQVRQDHCPFCFGSCACDGEGN